MLPESNNSIYFLIPLTDDGAFAGEIPKVVLGIAPITNSSVPPCCNCA